jgi:hypothetical protein
MNRKYFTLEEARKALPGIRDFIVAANAELEILAEDLIEANEKFDRLERRLTTANIMDVIKSDGGYADSSKKGSSRANVLDHVPHEEDEQKYERTAHELADMQNNYIVRLNYWVDKITEHGVVLRDLRSGLLDFPAREGALEYFLCWRLSDSDITTWHPIDEGFNGRKPLSVLIEYT